MNTVHATLREKKYAETNPLWQYDYGQKLILEGVDLPDAYEVLIGTMAGDLKKVIGNADGADIPDEFLATGSDIKAYVFLHTGANDGETEYEITIPVRRRNKATEEPVEPQEIDYIDQAIAALNLAVTKTERLAEEAESSAEASAESASSASESATQAAESEEAAAGSAQEAAASATQAGTKAAEASGSAAQAAESEEAAAGSAQEAAASATQAGTKATEAAGSATSAAGSAQAAQESAQTAQGASQGAAGSASNALEYANRAGTKAVEAAGSATSASQSAQAASASAQAAAGSAEDAEDAVEDTEAITFGTRGGTPVSSTDPYYENNAKYYKEKTEEIYHGEGEKSLAELRRSVVLIGDDGLFYVEDEEV